MIILGLIVGPAIGLLAGDFFGRYRGSRWLNVLAIALFIVFALFAPFFTAELRVGLIVGTLLGLLVYYSPFDTRSASATSGLQ